MTSNGAKVKPNTRRNADSPFPCGSRKGSIRAITLAQATVNSFPRANTTTSEKPLRSKSIRSADGVNRQ